MKKMEYVAPSMTVMVVELEKGFMSASVVDDRGNAEIKSVGQEYNEITFDDSSVDKGDITWE